jgi:glycerophosphoryl diester phosphodiesterase
MTVVFGHGPDATINRLGSFAHCRALGADGVELDVRRTADDRLVAIHDHMLDDGRHVAETMRQDLPPWIPDLADVLDECIGMKVNIEIKNFPRDPAFDPSQRVTELALELLGSRSDDAIISCFDFACIDLAKGIVPTAMLYLSRRPARDLLDAVVEHGHRVVHPYDTMVDETFMDEARARDLEVNVWLDAGIDRMRELVALGVDGLITSNVVDAVSASMERRAW